MSAAQPTLVYDAAFEEARERRGADRRSSARRPYSQSLHPLFAATLVNQIAAPEVLYGRGYCTARGPRAGIAIDVRA